jgi:hypothetical protein
MKILKFPDISTGTDILIPVNVIVKYESLRDRNYTKIYCNTAVSDNYTINIYADMLLERIYKQERDLFEIIEIGYEHFEIDFDAVPEDIPDDELPIIY